MNRIVIQCAFASFLMPMMISLWTNFQRNSLKIGGVAIFLCFLSSGAAFSQSSVRSDVRASNLPFRVASHGGEQPVLVRLAPSPNADKKAEEDERRQAESAGEEKRLTNATIGLFCVTALLALFTGGLWFSTYRLSKDAKKTSLRQTDDMQRSLKLAEQAAIAAENSNRLTREAFIASERPWVSVEAVVNRDFVKKQEGIEFGVLFTVKNHGRSPAVNVHIVYEVVTLKLFSANFEDVRKRIEQLGLTSGLGDSMGVQLFPSETKQIPWLSPLTQAELDAARGGCPGFCVNGFRLNLRHPFFKLDGEAV